jgi:hypothetical protein
MRVHAPWRGAAATAALVLLAACGQMQLQSAEEVYEGQLTGSQEVPPVDSAGQGAVEVRFNRNTNTIRWKVSHSGLSGPVTAAHLHGPAGPGRNAGVQVPLNPNAPSMAGEARLSPQQANEFTAGQWYLNLHTARHPDGEVRAQLRPRR